MPSQADLDQGGTEREWVNTYLGPSVGWVRTPQRNVLNIGIAGTYSLDLSTNLVRIGVAGLVTIILPSCQVASQGITLPGLFTKVSITIADVGGNAAAFPITIQPINNTETIMGLPQIQITSSFGGFILQPNTGNKLWSNAQ